MADTFSADPSVGAQNRIRALFAQIGLESLADQAWQAYKNGVDIDTILYDATQTPEFKSRYPAYEALAKKGQAMSVAAIIEYERGFSQLVHQYGLPAGFADPQKMQEALANGKSLQEVQGDIEQGVLRVQNAPQAVRDAYFHLFGIQGDQALLASAFNPEISLPELERRAAKAEVAGYGAQAGLNFTAPELQQFTDYTLDTGQIKSAIADVAKQRPLYTETIGEKQDLRAENEGIQAALGGGLAASEIELRRQRRAAATGGQVGSNLNDTGVQGLGTTRGA